LSKQNEEMETNKEVSARWNHGGGRNQNVANFHFATTRFAAIVRPRSMAVMGVLISF
jgi:hypothetical protein